MSCRLCRYMGGLMSCRIYGGLVRCRLCGYMWGISGVYLEGCVLREMCISWWL